MKVECFKMDHSASAYFQLDQMFFNALCILRLIQFKTEGQTIYTALLSLESSAGYCHKEESFHI